MTPNLAIGDTTLLIEAFTKLGWSIPQKAYGLATAFHETNGTMKPVEEAYWLTAAWRKKNLRYWPWHGRGYVQLTWERNYRVMAERLKRPEICANPSVLLTDAALSARVMAVGMQEGIYTGKRLDRYVNESQKGYRAARRVINGTDKAGLIASYAEKYETALRKAGNANLRERLRPAPKPSSASPASPSAPSPSSFWKWLSSFFSSRKS